MVNKITHFSDIATEISENQYAQTLLMSQLRSNFLVDSLNAMNAIFLLLRYACHKVNHNRLLNKQRKIRYPNLWHWRLACSV